MRKLYYKTALVLAVFLLGILASRLVPSNYPLSQNADKDAAEFGLLLEKNPSIAETFDFFTNLAQKKGPEYAYDVLSRIPEGRNVDIHLLGHVIGDVLYKQQGVEGIKLCTQEFRNACSHSIVVGYLLENGEGALPKIADICRNAPGKNGAYTMCFHGLGHGVLAYTGYEFKKAAEICERTNTERYGYTEGPQCIGGAVMEIIGGGFHNHDLWVEQSPKYLPKNDPIYLCKSDLVPQNAKNLCYLYLTPHLFASAGMDLGKIDPGTFKKAFSFCNPITDTQDRDSCYGGFGKEFIVMANNRDIRMLKKMDQKTVDTIYKWCDMAGSRRDVNSCVQSAGASLYWGGENDRSIVISFCKGSLDPEIKNNCFNNAIQQVYSYIPDRNYREGFCQELPSEFIENCKNKLAI